MDGTLWDSAAEVAESWNETVKRAGYDRKPITVKDIQSVMGKTMDVIARILFPDLEEDERQKLLAQCGEEENEYLRIHGATLYPDIRRTMEQLKKKYHLYIVSNCQSGYIEAFLDYYKLHDLIVGDIQGDYDASMDAGVKFIHAAYGFGTIEDKVPEIHKFCELENVADQVLQ